MFVFDRKCINLDPRRVLTLLVVGHEYLGLLFCIVFDYKGILLCNNSYLYIYLVVANVIFIRLTRLGKLGHW